MSRVFQLRRQVMGEWPWQSPPSVFGAGRSALTRRQLLVLLSAAAGARICPASAEQLSGIAAQPYFAGVSRALEAMAALGAPIAAADTQQIAALTQANDSASIAVAEKILDRYTLARLSVNGDGSPQLGLGGARRVLVEQGWRMFLVRVENRAGKTENINFARSWFAQTPGHMLPGSLNLAQRAFLLDTLNKAPLIEKMWLLSRLHGATNLSRYGIEIPAVALSGFPLEYHVIQVFNRDRGPRSTDLTLSIIPKIEDVYPSFSASKKFDFECLPTRDVLLVIHDLDGRGCMASLTIKDLRGLIYPPQAMRLAPDMFFQEHIYRADGETVRLPDGQYSIESKRGPEYLPGMQTLRIGDDNDRIEVKLRRWIDPAQWGWYSGDTHIHAGGCLHYQNPTEGVSPETMIRHVRGEGLHIGDVLTWGPSWYYQKQFFTGQAQSPAATLERPQLQAANNAIWQPRSTPKDGESLLRYDVEVSGFPSSLCGHLILLRLKEQDYPGTQLIEEWPSWNLPILKWARAQGAMIGYAHCGEGMVVESTALPNYVNSSRSSPFHSLRWCMHAA